MVKILYKQDPCSEHQESCNDSDLALDGSSKMKQLQVSHIVHMECSS